MLELLDECLTQLNHTKVRNSKEATMLLALDLIADVLSGHDKKLELYQQQIKELQQEVKTLKEKVNDK